MGQGLHVTRKDGEELFIVNNKTDDIIKITTYKRTRNQWKIVIDGPKGVNGYSIHRDCIKSEYIEKEEK